jgi:hypothetical protein
LYVDIVVSLNTSRSISIHPRKLVGEFLLSLKYNKGRKIIFPLNTLRRIPRLSLHTFRQILIPPEYILEPTAAVEISRGE